MSTEAEVWTGQAGSLRLERLGPHASCLTAVGVVDQGAVAFLREALPAMLDGRDGEVSHFIDFEKLERPDPEVRNAYVSMLLERRGSLRALHSLMDKRSTLVMLVVSAAGLVFGDLVNRHKDRASFETAKRQALMPKAA